MIYLPAYGMNAKRPGKIAAAPDIGADRQSGDPISGPSRRVCRTRWTAYDSALTTGCVPHVLTIVGPAPVLRHWEPQVFHQGKEHRSTPL